MQASLTTAAISDRGKVRSHNEDAYAILESSTEAKEHAGIGTLLIVADGLGGHNAGEVASQMAIDTIAEHCRQTTSQPLKTLLHDAIQEAHQSILSEARGNTFRQGMGTTIALVAINGNKATVAHVGDSRVYLLRNGVLSRLTLDHSWVEQQILAGGLPVEAAEEHPLRHVVTQALGAMETVEPTTYSWELKAGDTLLLSTDGLHGLVDAQSMHRILSTQMPADAVSSLVELARQQGGPDNITLIVARVDTVSHQQAAQ